MSTKILATSEIASWSVNGVNKIFTTLKDIHTINTITINNNTYSQYSFVWNIVTLDDAPSSWTVLVTYNYESNYDYLDNTWWIVWEIMIGTINSSNKVFSSFYNISLVDEVRVNGLVVTWYTIAWNRILLVSAPTTWYVEIDYFRKDLTIIDYNRDVYFTKKEVRDKVYNEISQDDTSVQYPKLLVDSAIVDWVNEIVTHISDKSRFANFSIDSVATIKLSPKDNSISTFDIVKDKVIPPKWRLLNATTWSIIDYSSINSSNVMSISYIDSNISEPTMMSVWYQLPRNIKRVISVTYNWVPTQDAGSINNFLYGNWFYFINNWYIYLKHKAKYTIEVELNEYINSDDDSSLVYIDRDDVGVVVYYALRQLYQSRESDKLNSVSQLYIDKLKSYKRRMNKKRGSGKNNVMLTSGRLTTNNINRPGFPITQLVPQIIIKPSDSIDGWFANN